MESVINQFTITKEDLEKIIAKLHEEMENGLKGKPSTLQMLATYAPIPTGKEEGTFMGIDVGGTNLRVLTLELKGGKRGDVNGKECVMPKTSTTADAFFGFIATKIKEFINEYKLEDKQIKAGLTFSFAVEQISINSGIQKCWSKGWNIPETIGKDIVAIAHEQLKKVGVNNVEIVALVNDTVGTLANLAYDDQTTGMGLIFGTGTNGCYIEKTSNFAECKFKSHIDPNKQEYMVVNTEWGGLNVPELKVNEFDKMIDEVSNNKGKQTFEKLISGIYMGWLARLAIRSLIEKKIIFERYINHVAFSNSPDDTDSDHSKKFTSRNTGIVEDNTNELEEVKKMLEGLGINDSTLEERKIVKEITTAVVKRAAYLSAAATISLYRKMKPFLPNKTTVAIDGSVYEKSVPFKRYYAEAIKLLEPTATVETKLSKDGSGLGAVILAAAVSSQK